LIEQDLTAPSTQYRLSGRRFYRLKDPTNSIKVPKEKDSYQSAITEMWLTMASHQKNHLVTSQPEKVVSCSLEI